MAFSFGGAATNAQPSTSLFGGNNAAAGQSTNTGFGGFGGAQNAAQPAAGGLFGSTPAANNAAPSGGLFGSTGAANKPSLFVSTPTGTSKPGGLFGSQPAAGGGLFGSTQQPAAGGSGMFGQQQQQGQQQGQQQQGGGLFGSQQQQQQPAAGGLFGSQTQQAGGFGAKPGGLFGSTTAPAQQPGGLFGSQQQQQQQQPAGGLFGSTQQQQQPAGGLFGAKPAGGMFGSTTQQPQASGLFGSTAQPQQGLFASTAQQGQASTFGASTTAPGMGASVAFAGQEESIESRIMKIKNGWDVNSPDCRFKYYFYNVVQEGTTQFYVRPPGATDDAKWSRAVRDNPDPTTMVPVLATGWGDVQKRVQAMNQTASVHQERVKELNQALANLNRQTALSASVRLAALQAHLQQLTQRLLHLAAQSPTFAPPQSSAFRPEEAEMKHTLEAVKDSLDGRVRAHTKSGAVGLVAPRSQNKGRMLGQINELWGAVEEVRRQRRARGDTSWAGDERMLVEMATVLEQQQTALSKLSELASDAVFDADVVRQGLAAVEGRK